MTKHFHIFDKSKHDKEIVHYDTSIIGGGPAGLTAAIYSARYGLHTALISKDVGGMANYAHKIENYPGYEGSGSELMQKFYQQAINYGSEYLNSEVGDITKDPSGFVITLTDGKVVHSKTIIIALGTEKRKLNIKGEQELIGKGVSYCAACDAAFFRNKAVAVVGGGDSACKAALIISEFAKKTYLVYRGEDIKCETVMKKKIKAKEIELLLNSVPIEIEGENSVKALLVEKDEELKRLELSGVFIEIGAVPVTSLVHKLGIKTDKAGFLIVDENMSTNVKGIFAAGDFIRSKLKQVIIAASQGALAAKSASDLINESAP